MKHGIRHDLQPQVARKVLQQAFETYRAKFPDSEPELEWLDQNHARVQFTAKGAPIRGDIELKEREIDIDLDVPFYFRPFKNRALRIIEREVQEWTVRAKRGEIA